MKRFTKNILCAGSIVFTSTLVLFLNIPLTLSLSLFYAFLFTAGFYFWVQIVHELLHPLLLRCQIARISGREPDFPSYMEDSK